MNKHAYELLALSRAKARQYEREAAQYSRLPKRPVRHHVAAVLRGWAERLEPTTAPATKPIPALERSF